MYARGLCGLPTDRACPQSHDSHDSTLAAAKSVKAGGRYTMQGALMQSVQQASGMADAECAALPTQVKADVHPYCVMDEAVGAYAVPDQARVLSARVMVATCGAAGMLREAFPDLDPGAAGGDGSGQDLGITHVMIDEAGQVIDLHL